MTKLDIDEALFAPLIVDEVNKAAISAQALLPGQHPAFAQTLNDIQVAGVKATIQWASVPAVQSRFHLFASRPLVRSTGLLLKPPIDPVYCRPGNKTS
ncbi:hypothetical protein [Pseudomonas syringae]